MLKRSAMALALVVAATAANAAETTGTIQSIDTKTDAVTLSDGSTYTLPESVEAESLNVGDKIHLTYNAAKGKNKASSLNKTR